MRYLAPTGGFYHEEPQEKEPSSPGTEEKVLSINMFKYLTTVLILGIRNIDSVTANIRVTREAHGIGEETVITTTLDPGVTKYWILNGMFIYHIYTDRKIKIAYIPVIDIIR